MKKPHLLQAAYFLGLLLLLTMSAGRVSVAGTVPDCTPETCNWTMSVTNDNGLTDQASGMYMTDADGNISLAQPVTVELIDGSSVTLGGMSGNIDPVLGFSVSASTSSIGSTFGFTFNLPIALSGPINANSEVSYSLTSNTAAGADIKPLFPDGTIVSAFEADSSVGGLDSLNKGVDVGDRFFFLGGPDTQNSPEYSASNTFTGDLAYDLMTVKVDFILSPSSNVGISGFVQQLPVPIPAAVWLFGSGLIGLIAIARRKKV